ncbi:MAG TPA: phosphoglycolate phosphatase [Gemmatimonadaceae bacterium]|nr:phosphoglycolate phosphatase [Gemmatimonadaceae bacterium]
MRLIDCIEAVAFDLDGTLIDTAPDLAAAANSMLRILGGRPLPEHRVAALIGDGVDPFVARVLAKNGGASQLDATLLPWARVLFRNLYEQHLFARGRVFPGVEQALQALENAELPLCCITNKESRFALPLLEAAGLRERFLVTVCADRPEDRKPSPSMLLAACRQLGVEPANLLYVGDSRSDIAAARAARCRVAAVTYGYGDYDVLEAARPDGILSNLAKITSIRLRPRTGVPALRVVQ